MKDTDPHADVMQHGLDFDIDADMVYWSDVDSLRDVMQHGLDFDIDEDMVYWSDVDSLRDDVNTQREEYTDALSYLADMIRDAETDDETETAETAAERIRDYLRELDEDSAAFLDFASEFEGYSGAGTAISADYFQTYAQQLADDISSADTNRWPFTCIDWEAAANELAHDYTTIEHGDVSYYVQ